MADRTEHRAQQLTKMGEQPGFIAALDQSGGSTPKALALYGIEEGRYSSDEEMYQLVHAMRTRIVTSGAFDGGRILGAILFENTLDRDIEGRGSADYLWSVKGVVPFLKVDKGLADEADGVQPMKPMPELDALLAKAVDRGVFGTKMRSVIKSANAKAIGRIVDQQFELAERIVAAGLVPIVEPEVDIHTPDKAAAEELLRGELLSHLQSLPAGAQLLFKLTLPEQANLYAQCLEHPAVVRVVALSGGYAREEANRRLAANTGVVASFSRALTEGLTEALSPQDFDARLDAAIQSIYDASLT